MKGMKPETFAKEFDFSVRYVSLLCRQEGVNKKDCSKRFHEEDVLIFSSRKRRIVVQWRGNKLVRPRLVDRV